jgi:hypothetical protein
MIKDLNSQMLIQTILELDMQLARLSDKLSKSSYLELGDDPRVISQVETDLKRIKLQIRSLGSHFDLSITPLSKANRYFAAAYSIEDALRFVEEVRERAFGSTQNTRKFLEKLNDCMDSVRQINLSADYHQEMMQ